MATISADNEAKRGDEPGRPAAIEGRNLVTLCDGTGNELAVRCQIRRATSVSPMCSSSIASRRRDSDSSSITLPASERLGALTGSRGRNRNFSAYSVSRLDNNVIGAYRFLVGNWREGDRIYLFGFSRGAWTARVLAGLLHLIGLVRPSQLNMCDNALATYKRAARDDQLPIAWHFGRVIGARFPIIHFVGFGIA